MLRKSISLLAPDLPAEVEHLGSAYYSAQDALQALIIAQENFRGAVATGAFSANRVEALLHELDDMRDEHQAATQRAFASFQDAAFTALETGMTPGFRGHSIVVTERTTPEIERTYPVYRYARIDLRRDLHITPSGLALYVGENPDRYCGPDPIHGRKASNCRMHRFADDTSLEQAWDWTFAWT